MIGAPSTSDICDKHAHGVHIVPCWAPHTESSARRGLAHTPFAASMRLFSLIMWRVGGHAAWILRDKLQYGTPDSTPRINCMPY
eukprot:13995636-Heterocapsa_arctica.AAC.1